MKRDMDLVRLLLQRSAGDHAAASKVEEYPVEDRAYHVALLKDAGFVEASILKDEYGQPAKAAVVRLTWQGHEFLQAMSDDGVWDKVKKTVMKDGVAWTTSLLLLILKQEAKNRLSTVLGYPLPDDHSTSHSHL